MNQRPESDKPLIREIFRSLLSEASFAAVLLDPEYRVAGVNTAYLELLDVSEDELAGHSMPDLLRTRMGPFFKDAASLADILQEAHDSNSRIEQLECTVAGTPDGQPERSLLLTSIPIADGLLAGHRVEYAIDCSSSKTAQSRLSQIESEWQAVIEAWPDFLVRVTTDGKILYINKVLQAFTVDSVRGSSVYDWYSDADAETMRKAFARVMRTGQPTSYEVCFEAPDSPRVIFETHVAPIWREGEVHELVLACRDVTARKDAERQLAEEHERAGLYLDAVQTIVLVMDTEGRVELLNRRGAEVMRYSQEELRGQNWLERCIPPRNWARDTKAYADYVKSDLADPYEYSNEVVTKDGEVRAMIWTALLLRDETGAVTGVLCSGEDITERNRTVNQLISLHKHLDHILATSPAVVYTCGPAPDYPTLFISDNVYQRLGYKPEEFYADPFFWTHHIHPDDRQGILQQLRQIDPTRSLTYEYRFLNKNGSYVWLADEVMAEQDESGNIGGLIGSWVDITQLREADEAKRESERTLSTLISNLPGIVYRCLNDRDWTVLFISDGCKDLTGYNAHELRNSSVVAYNDLIHPDDRQQVADNVAQAIELDQPFQFEYRIITKGRVVKWVWEQGRATTPSGQSPQLLEGVITDISARKRAEEMLQTTAKRLQQESKEVAEKNIALKQVLDHLEREQQTYRHNFSREVGLVVRPLLEKLKQHPDPHLVAEIDTLSDVVYTLLEKEGESFREHYLKLTARELEICDLIKEGLSSKEIASRLNVSILTVHKHREQIREKLGLTNKGINLAAYLRMPPK